MFFFVFLICEVEEGGVEKNIGEKKQILGKNWVPETKGFTFSELRKGVSRCRYMALPFFLVSYISKETPNSKGLRLYWTTKDLPSINCHENQRLDSPVKG